VIDDPGSTDGKSTYQKVIIIQIVKKWDT
jgi:hypothetical protein